MGYEKDLTYLRKEFKKSEDKFRESEREGYETDADMWQNDMVNIGHQIHIHEQASKADEYEVKAKAWDLLRESLENYVDTMPFTEGQNHVIVDEYKQILRVMERFYKEVEEDDQ